MIFQKKQCFTCINTLIICILVNVVILLPKQVFAQSAKDNPFAVKTALVYKFVNFIQWENQSKMQNFTIGLFTDDSIAIPYFRALEKYKTVNGKPIKLLLFKQIKNITNTNVLFISSDRNDEIEEIFAKINTNSTLLISNCCTNQKFVMINFLCSKDTLQSVKFEVNKKNIAEHNMTVMPKLLLLGGTEIDLRLLYNEQEKVLQSEKEKVEKQIEEIKHQQEIINKQKSEIEKQQELLNKQAAELEAQWKKLNEQNAKLQLVESEVSRQQKLLIQKIIQLNKYKSELDTFQRRIYKQESEIKDRNIILQKQESEITAKQSLIKQQKEVLGNQLVKINTQKSFMYLLYSIIFLILLLALFILRNYTMKQKANRKLAEKNAEILQKNEEVQVQAEQLEAANGELEKLSIVASETDNAVIIASPDGEFIWVNAGFKRLYNLSLEEFKKTKGDNFFATSNIASIRELLSSSVKENRSVVYTNSFYNTCNEEVWVQTTLTPIFDNEGTLYQIIAIESDITQIKIAEEEIIKQSEEIKQKSEELRAQSENLKEINEALEIEKSNTELTLEHLKQTQSMLVQQEKMASLGQLTAGIAHEINNPVNFISSGIDSLRLVLGDLLTIVKEYDNLNLENTENQLNIIKELKDELDYDLLLKGIGELSSSIKTGADRTAEIVRGLRKFSRLDEDSLKMIDLHENIDATLVILHNQYKERIEIVRQYGDLPAIECNPGKLNQVFLNILVNAIEAIENKGIISIKTKLSLIETKKYVEIHITDTGIGMTEEVKKRIFEPFFTKKDVGKGTGLGLSISYGIIEQHKGKIEVISQKGVGTEFIVYIPIN